MEYNGENKHIVREESQININADVRSISYNTKQEYPLTHELEKAKAESILAKASSWDKIIDYLGACGIILSLGKAIQWVRNSGKQDKD